MNAQSQDKEYGRYRLHKKWASNDTVYIKIGTKIDTLKAGWTLKEKVGKFEIERILENDSLIKTKIDSAIVVKSNWKISEVLFEDKDPSKLYINPYNFKRPDEKLSNKGYIKIPENSYALLTKSYLKWSAVTVPFAIRPKLNDTIGSKVTTDLKIGASFSYNYNLEFFKNRRLKAKKSVYGISAGLGFGFSKVTLDESSTSLANKPITKEEDGLAFFIGPGIGINLKGFQIFGIMAWDIGITDNVKKWNYNKERYFGIGLGVDLSTFGKQ
ncbi:hypothetical protein A8C32_14595 [Flavivirga aquatica]|uniref:Outer membrane protein beta-barrel domain-containing protein n=2 Tax=Flavivirga aquatica TaxID=1849968 RepID=A0A1E5TC32_9FLAO|nr:hypothetical protein A8C32_14595 [Flavivirga aquatica]